jgi:hypothetical protein
VSHEFPSLEAATRRRSELYALSSAFRFLVFEFELPDLVRHEQRNDDVKPRVFPRSNFVLEPIPTPRARHERKPARPWTVYPINLTPHGCSTFLPELLSFDDLTR